MYSFASYQPEQENAEFSARYGIIPVSGTVLFVVPIHFPGNDRLTGRKSIGKHRMDATGAIAMQDPCIYMGGAGSYNVNNTCEKALNKVMAYGRLNQ